MGTNLIGGGILALIVFGILWLFFGATWWVILTSVVIGGMGVMNHSEKGEDSKSLRASLTTGISPFDANSIDGKSARLILASALEQKDFVWENTIEPIATETIRFLANRGIGSLEKWEDIQIGSGRYDCSRPIIAAAEKRAVLSDLNETEMQRWLDVCLGLSDGFPDPHAALDINRHFLVWIRNVWSMNAGAGQSATICVDFAFSNAFTDFGRIFGCGEVRRLTNPEILAAKLRKLEDEIGNKTQYPSLTEAFKYGFPDAPALGVSQEEYNSRVLPLYDHLEDVIHKEFLSVPLHECTEEILEDAIGESFRRFVRASDLPNNIYA